MFTSWEFWLFVFVIAAVHRIAPKNWQNGILLAASYAIYFYLEPRFFILLVLVTGFNYWIARRLIPSVSNRQIYFWIAVAVNIGVLGLFKYGLGLTSLVNPILDKLGVVHEPLFINFVLPLGLSFYSFRALAYIFDVYNGQLEQEVRPVDLALYIAFFPQVVSGPIVRPLPFITACKTVRRLSVEQVIDGLTFILMGIFYKVAIADPLYKPLLTTNIASMTSTNAWSEYILYTVRLYADFAGYSLLAIGVSTWFGLPTIQNFRQPYFSRTISEFWDRWHISLSTWNRDYVFYPISRASLRRWGNRHARTIQVTALLISMIISGMWHGTGFRFIVWGALHGIYLSIERVFFPRARLKPKNASRLSIGLQTVVGVLITLIAVSTAWVFFRANSVSEALLFFQRMFSSNPLADMSGLKWIEIIIPIVLLLIIDIPQAISNNPLFLWQIRPVWRVTMCTILLLCIFIFGSQSHAPFIYAQF
jgi:alginate O-acetyltransferase complex protein AlgI